MTISSQSDYDAIVVGAGFGGMYMIFYYSFSEFGLNVALWQYGIITKGGDDTWT